MVFAGLSFLIFFFPTVIVIHNLINQKYKNLFLLVASLIFYAWGDIRYIPLLLFISLIHYVLCLNIKKYKKFKLAICIILDLGFLFYYKYMGFIFEQIGLTNIASNISLPLGISFFTFQSMSYVIDVYRGDVESEKSFINYLSYILMFPQLIAGPIVRYTDVKQNLNNRQISANKLELGTLQFIIGLASKVLLANKFAYIFSNANTYNSSFASFVVIFATGMQYYFDFAGYSLMAIGMGNMLGFDFPQNFNHPYSAYSVSDFWRRWHITLGTWFREYVYIPLGGNRKGLIRHIINISIVWLLTGFWHGASWNFIVWGLYFAIMLIFEKYLLKNFLHKNSILSHIYALIVIFIAWAFVGYNDLNMAIYRIKLLFSFVIEKTDIYLLQLSIIPILISIILCIPKVINAMEDYLIKNGLVRIVICATLLIICIANLVSAGFNPFLYFRF